MGRDKTLGLVTVTNAGTPVQASSTDVFCVSYLIEPWPSNTGKIWVGTASDMNKTTGAKIRAYLPIPNANVVSAFSDRGTSSVFFNLKDMWLDADVNGEGAIISYDQG